MAYEEADNTEDGLLDVGALCRMFEESEEATQTARGLAERDRDYYDNKQLTPEEIAALGKRGQPPVIINRIKRKIDYLVGLEKEQRTMPRALPRTPMHEQDAQAATDGLRFVAESEDYSAVRSGAWKNMLIEGIGVVSVSVEFSRSDLMNSTALSGPNVKIKLRHFAWDRFFYDPHSAKPDFSDATYMGGIVWMDYDDAIAMYPDKQEALSTTLTGHQLSETYDDTPKYLVWADRKRKRVRVVQIWIKRADQWYFAEFTKGGILQSGPSPYYTDDGESECELIAQSAYVDRDNNRFGVVREMISPQDEINKRRSKSLHLLNTSQVIMETGAVDNVEKARREAAKPDGVIVVNPSKKFEFNTRSDLAQGHLGLLQEAKNEIDMMGPNASMQGETGQTASGRAILASQQGGMIQMGDLLDNLRHMDRRVFRAIWSRIRQFWTAPMWVRITDDERNVKFAGLNGAVNQDGSIGQQVAQMDVDIIIDDAPDSVAPAIEQYQMLTELKKFDANGELPFKALVQAMPNLRNKDKVLEMMEQAGQRDPMEQQIKMRGVSAEIAEKESSAAKNAATAQKTSIEAQRLMIEPIQPEVVYAPV